MINISIITKYIKIPLNGLRSSIGIIHENRRTLSDYLEIISKAATILAIIVGGIWTYRNFTLERTDFENPQIIVDPQVMPYTDEKVLLVANVTIKNVGKRIVRINKNGCTVSVLLIPPDEPLYERLKFFDHQATVKSENILDEYYRNEEWQYELEPGTEYHEIYRAVMPRDRHAHLKVSLHFGPLSKDDAITEYRIVHLHPKPSLGQNM